MRTPFICSLASMAAALLCSATLTAGPLNPPAGAVTGTAKPLSEVEPRTAINAANTPGNAATTFRITAPGSYYLTGNLTGEPNKSGISIEASDVTIDLNGFAVVGVANSLNAFTSSGARTNLRITNGTIRNWGLRAVSVTTFTGGELSRLRISDNSTAGSVVAVLTGPSFVIGDCTASGNAAGGLSCGVNGVITRCIAESNGGGGIGSGTNSLITDCTARANTGTGIGPGAGSIVRGCVVSSNGGNGIDITTQVRVEGCSLIGNVGFGVDAGISSVVRNNTFIGISAAGTAGGVLVNTGCIVHGNSFRSAAVGVQTTGTDNVITGNHFATHANTYIITAGNHFGPFIVSGSNGALVSGNGAVASTMGSTDPSANFID